ncbi:MAG: hydantoinase/carbamoylase family amidase [Pseudolabrys sp.]|nr:hydantoinase/carbamoylase family amidase [Pseudolabrys sp.]
MNAPTGLRDGIDARQWRELAERLFDELRTRSIDDPGVTRECYAAGENAAITLLRETAAEYGLVCTEDRAANLTISLPDDDLGKPGIILGSHVDSVPHGGNFDGGAGVIAGLLCLIRLRAERHAPVPPVRLLALRGEESAYYGRANMGSRALFGLLTPADLDAKRQSGGGTLREAMASVGADVDAIAQREVLLSPDSVSSYLELHIEQGPVMVARDLPTAIVTGIRGNLRHRRVACRGEAGHSGTVPRWLRRDAVFAVSDLIMRLDEHWNRLLERGIDLVVTAGVFGTDSSQHAIARIPGEVYFSFEVRSQSYDTLEGFYELFRSECRAVADLRRVKFEFDDRIYTEPARMDEGIIARLKKYSEKLGYPTELIPSGAGHDAAVFANAGVPSGMIFVRNRNGSHNPDEAMALDDFMRGVELMYAYASTGTPS